MSEQNQSPVTAIEVKNKAGQLVSMDYGEFAGAGSVNLPTSGRIQFITILQSNSKALKPGHEKYVDGAKMGDFLMGGEVISGSQGVFFVGIEKEHVLVEMTKVDGTGEKVGEHDPNGPVAQKARAQFGSNRNNWRSEKGNFLVDSIRLYGVVFASKADMDALKPKGAAVIDFQKTKMRAWEYYTSPFNKIPEAGRPPLFACRIHVTTKMENRKGHDYYNIDIKFADGNDFLSSLYSMKGADGAANTAFIEFGRECLKVAQSVKSGSLKSEENTEDDGDAGTADGKGGTIPF